MATENLCASSDTRSSRTDEFAKGTYVWPVRADAASIHRQAEIFRLFYAEAGVVEFSEAVTFRRHQAIAARQIHWARRAARTPWLSYDIEKIVPVTLIPHNSSRRCGYSL